MNEILNTLASKYNWQDTSAIQLHSGLINTTFKVTTNNEQFIVQKINSSIFTNPTIIHNNLNKLQQFLVKTNSNYHLIAPIKGVDGKTIYSIKNQYYRAFQFINHSHTIPVVHTSHQAFEAAKQFAYFTKTFNKFHPNQLQITLPNFHDLNLRYQQFLQSIQLGNKQRIEAQQQLIDTLLSHEKIVLHYNNFIQHADAKIRVTHHDTKISNVLFNQKDEAIAVIDLDTVMPGYFLSDVGDMIRTYVSPVSEEEKDYSKIIIRKNMLTAIYEGYLTYMNDELTNFETENFYFAGEMMIFMQALRFITDYFNNDSYYTTQYPQQNLTRANNQLHLLKLLQAACK